MSGLRSHTTVREILFVVGEPSGDLHASSVARELKARGAPFDLRGIGGDMMQSAGVRIDEHIRGLAVLGFVEVLRHTQEQPLDALLEAREDKILGYGKYKEIVSP